MIPLLRNKLINTSFPFIRYTSCSVSLRFISTPNEGNSVSSLAILDLFLHKYQISPEVASKAASDLHLSKDLKKSDLVLSFLKEIGFSNAQLEKLLTYRPRLLVPVGLEDGVIPKIRVLQDLGIPSNAIPKLISSSPSILGLNMNSRVVPNFYKLKDFLGTSDDAVAKLSSISGWVLLCDLERTMFPNIEFLKSCGIPMERILKLLYYNPRCFLLKPETIRMSLEKVEEMGVDRTSNAFIIALRVVSSQFGKTWELKLLALQDCGFSKSDLMKMFAKAPHVFGGSVEKLKRTKDVLLATGKYDLSCIVNNPTSLACSVEKRYKPRFRILEILEGKNLIKTWPSLSILYSTTDKKFFEKFVGRYLKGVDGEDIAKDFVGANKNVRQRIGYK